MYFTFIIGMQWGDEGKGKFADYYAPFSKNVVRYNGGNNSGHTIIKDGKKLVTHILPSGIMRDDVCNFIVRGTVVDPFVLVSEIEEARKLGCAVEPMKNLRISEDVSLILPFHIEIDKVRESRLSNGKLGTTNKGIGPAYEDFFGRRTICLKELFDRDALLSKIRQIIHEKRLIINDLSAYFGLPTLIKNLMNVGEFLKPFMVKDEELFEQTESYNPNFLMEGAQAVMLDVFHGDYPYVTSSSVLPQWFSLHYPHIDQNMFNTIGVFKAYATRVGSGPFPTQMGDAEQGKIREIGKEYGATTGRARKCGWLDLTQVAKAIKISRPSDLIMTKADVLGSLEEIKVCIGYENDVPVYETFSGWGDLQTCKEPNDFPQEFKRYINFIEEILKIRIRVVSTGPDREQIINC